jgi:hypothetical protein
MRRAVHRLLQMVPDEDVLSDRERPDAAAIIRAHRSGAPVAAERAGLVPDGEDGARGVRFVAAAVYPAAAGGAWTPAWA